MTPDNGVDPTVQQPDTPAKTTDQPRTLPPQVSRRGFILGAATAAAAAGTTGLAACGNINRTTEAADDDDPTQAFLADDIVPSTESTRQVSTPPAKPTSISLRSPSAPAPPLMMCADS